VLSPSLFHFFAGIAVLIHKLVTRIASRQEARTELVTVCIASSQTRSVLLRASHRLAIATAVGIDALAVFQCEAWIACIQLARAITHSIVVTELHTRSAFTDTGG
jgi:hypothetical protein